MSGRTTSLWKFCERKHSAMLGGTGRTGPMGRDTYDFEHPVLAPESKERASIPSWIRNAMGQAVTNAKDSGKLPVLILHEKSTHYTEDLVVIRLREFVEIVRVLTKEYNSEGTTRIPENS